MICFSIALLLISIWLPVIFLRSEPEQPEPIFSADLNTDPPSPSVEADSSPTYTPALPGIADSGVTLTVLHVGKPETVTLSDYLPGVVAGEMPADFEYEALKAQAVAARTYIFYHMEHPPAAHPDYPVCDDSTCCKAWLSCDEMAEKWGDKYEENLAKVSGAAADTDGQYLVWEGHAIQAVFHSSSAGYTESSSELWGYAPYLVSVPTPETENDVPDFVSTVEVSCGDLRSTILDAFPDAVFSDDAAQWLGACSYSANGRVSSRQIGGVSVSGVKLRELFSLRSTAFTLEYTGSSFLFTVTGYGHGVGMSQYGANVLAESGLDYSEILGHYYPGTVLYS